MVTTGNDVIQLLLAIPLTFVAGRGHRPRWLALGMLGAVLGCFLASVPHFLFGSGHTTVTTATSLPNTLLFEVHDNSENPFPFIRNIM